MKQSVSFLIILAIILSFTNCKRSTNDIIYDKKYIEPIKAARDQLGFYMARNLIPGASIAVIKNNQLIYSEALGQASKELEVPAKRETKFRIGELSEIFTSFIYLQMVEEGILHPDSTIQHYLPAFPEKEYHLRLQYLVNHTSGIREPNENEEEWRALNVTIEAGLDQFKDDPLSHPPTMYQTPSMYNYNLLGAVMEKATGKRFHQLLKTYITDTLKLSNTVIDNPLINIPGRTQFYDHNIVAQVVNATTRDMRYRAPSQGLLSTSEDIAKFGYEIIHTELLSEETKNTMFESIPLFDSIPSGMANGWLLMSDSNFNTIYGKGGSVTGGNASILIYPEYDLVVACATNLSTHLNDTPIFEIASNFLPESARKKEEEQSEDN